MDPLVESPSLALAKPAEIITGSHLGRVRPDTVVVTPPTLDDGLRFAWRVEYLAVEEFVAKTRVEALDVAVSQGLPRSI